MTFVDFREKGTDPRCGGFVRADSDAERDEVTAFLKERDFKVTWDVRKGNK